MPVLKTIYGTSCQSSNAYLYGRGTKGHYVYMKIATTVADVPMGLFVQVIGCSCTIADDCLFNRGKFSYFFFLFLEESLHFSCL